MKVSRYLVFLIALLIGLWYGNVNILLSTSGANIYTWTGVALTLMFLMVGLNFYFQVQLSKRKVALSVILNSLMIFLFLLVHKDWVMPICGTAQGLLIGLILKDAYRRIGFNAIVSMSLLGYFLAWFTYFLPMDTSPTLIADWSFSALIIMVLTWVILKVILIILLQKQDLDQQADRNPIGILAVDNQQKSITMQVFILLNVCLGISFFTWAMILLDYSQSWANTVILPATLMVAFVLVRIVQKGLYRMDNAGWLFTGSLILMLSLGMFYTLDLSLLFIVSFGTFIVITTDIASRLMGVPLTEKHLGWMFMITALSMLIAGLYVDNHIAYIRSIKMPENLLALSTIQAWSQELASVAAIMVILSGIVFLKRKQSESVL